ncbi:MULTISPECIES: FAD-dependent oxidoreductase [unclassified Leucobacter]|uniref:FAD-dependent oxidoreductase n=1 Tax=unclassified Leucobacter TaxID=2621730 RepID=UPI003015E1B7
MNDRTWDTIVIGGGAAGLSAAQALGRSLRRTLVIDAGSPRNRFASHMHNVLGLDGTPPLELLARGRAEAERYGVEFRAASVLAVRDGGSAGSGSRSALQLVLDGGDTIEARSVIVATGVTDALPTIPGLAEHWGERALHCPYCHGWEVRGQRIAVVAASPLAMHQARLLRQWTDSLTVFTAGLGDLTSEARREFAARGVHLVAEPVTEIVGDGSRITAVRTASGEVAVDAVFTSGELVPHDGFLTELELDRSETPMGSVIAVDPTGRTSHPRVWAAGNVVNPAASVPIVMGAGTLAGAAANAALVEEDYAIAVAADDPAATAAADPAPIAPGHHGTDHEAAHDARHPHPDPDEDPVVFWERRYGSAGPIWSGHVNRSLADATAGWVPGRSLDLGCGEGGDVLWLAEQGWQATGIDLSETAVARAAAAAREQDLPGARFIAADLGDWVEDPAAIDGSDHGFDLITASFLQSPVELPRERILRAAAERVAPGGSLVVISHGAPPPWAQGHAGPFPTPESELALLDLDPEQWCITAESRKRAATAPDGSGAMLDDTVIVATRTAAGPPAQ